MSLTRAAERFTAPGFSRASEVCFGLDQLKDETVFVDVRLRGDLHRTLPMLKRVLEKLEQSLLRQKRIEMHRPVRELHLPSDFLRLFGHFFRQFLLQILDEVGRFVGNRVWFGLAQTGSEMLQIASDLGNHLAQM